MFQFDTFNIGEFDSKILASNSAIMYAVIGIVASPLTGLIFDKVQRFFFFFLSDSFFFLLRRECCTTVFYF